MYEEAMRNISDAVVRVEKLAELAERQVRSVDLELFRRLLELSSPSQETEHRPCHILPATKNKHFFGRKDIIRQIEDHLKPVETTMGLKSIALYGLGGVGKTQIALAYAHSKSAELEAVFWVHAENEISLQQSFSRIAVDGLQLPGANLQSHQENLVVVMSWLKQTSMQPGSCSRRKLTMHSLQMAPYLRQRRGSPNLQ